MTRRSSLLTLLLPALVAGGTVGCTGQSEPIPAVTLHTESSRARRETVAELRAAWRNREVPDDARGQKVEMRFLVRLSGAVPRFQGTESFGDFCRLWNECLRDHLVRFPDSQS